MHNGLELVVCAANVPFDETNIFYGALSSQVDKQIALIPDFIASCGAARLFALLMQQASGDVPMEDVIFKDLTHTCFTHLKAVHEMQKDPRNIMAKSLEIALHAAKQ